MDPVAGRKLGMSANQFINTAYAGIRRGENRAVVGSIGLTKDLGEINDTRRLA